MIKLFSRKKNTKNVKVLAPALDFSFEFLDHGIEKQIKNWVCSNENYLAIFARILSMISVPIKNVKFMKYDHNENSFTLLEHDAWTIKLRDGDWDFPSEIHIGKNNVTKKYECNFMRDDCQIVYRGSSVICGNCTSNSWISGNYASFSNVYADEKLTITLNLAFEYSLLISNNKSKLEMYVQSIPQTLSATEILSDIFSILEFSNDTLNKVERAEVIKTSTEKKYGKDGFVTHGIIFSNCEVEKLIDTIHGATTSVCSDGTWKYIDSNYNVSFDGKSHVLNGTVTKESNISEMLAKAESFADFVQGIIRNIYVIKK